jgi:hypothetical protein
MSKIEDPAKRIAFAMKAFGKPGAELAKMLLTAEEFQSQLAKARHFKGFVPDDAGSRMGEANDSIDDMKDSFEGLTDLISYETAPAFTNIISGIAEWIAANREPIATNVAGFLKSVGEYLKSVNWSGVIEGAKSFGRSIGTVVEAVGGFRNAMIGLAAIAFAPVATRIFALVRSLFLLGRAIAVISVAPLLAIAAAGVAIYREWDNIAPKLDEVGAAFGRLQQARNFSELVNGLRGVEQATEGVEGAVKNALERGTLDLANAPGDAGGQGTKRFLDALDAMPGQIGASLAGVGAAFAASWADVEAKWADGTARIRQAVADFASWLGSAAMIMIRGAVTGIGDVIAAPFRAAADQINKLRAMGNPNSIGSQGMGRGGSIRPATPGASVPSMTPTTPGPQASLIGRDPQRRGWRRGTTGRHDRRRVLGYQHQVA